MTARTWLKPAWCSPAMLCVSLSVAAHAVVLVGLTPSGRHGSGQAGHPSAARMQVRTMSLASPAATSANSRDIQPEAEQPPQHELPPSVQEVAVDSSAMPSAEHTEALTSSQADDSIQTSDTVTLPPRPYAEYIPRPQLSQPPVPRAPILIAPPEGDKEPARRVVVLSLYIDESGHVRHIEADDSDLPPAYVQAARTAFLAATFLPGQLEGQQVKSRTRVEVVFDNTPLDSAP